MTHSADREAADAFTSEGGRPAGAADERTLAELGITFDGRDYRYESYRYERLADALAYASLVRARRRAR